jgi:hypothetical protein
VERQVFRTIQGNPPIPAETRIVAPCRLANECRLD